MSKITFDPVAHRYYEGEIELPSLSRVMELGGLGPDFSMVRPEVLRRKAEIGTAVHRAIHLHLRNELDWTTIDSAALPYLTAALEYLQTEDRAIVSAETPYGSRKLGYATMPDLVLDGGLVEWKTTSRIYPSVAIQLGGQALAIGSKGIHRRVVQLKKDGRYKVQDFEDAGDIDVFKACLRIARWKLEKK